MQLLWRQPSYIAPSKRLTFATYNEPSVGRYLDVTQRASN